jgi:hypothetical protein
LESFEIGYTNPTKIDSGTISLFDRFVSGPPSVLGCFSSGGPKGLLAKSSTVATSVWSFTGVELDWVATDFAAANVNGCRADAPGADPALRWPRGVGRYTPSGHRAIRPAAAGSLSGCGL